MSLERACACGHIFRLDKAPPGTVCVCPKCGATTRFDAPPSARDEASPPAGKPLKPLWSVMGQSAPPESRPPAAARPKGLWNVMSGPATTPQPAASPPPRPREAVVKSPPPASPASHIDPVPPHVATVEDDAGPEFADVPVPRLSAAINEGRSQKAVWSIALGGASLALSLLSLIPAFWSKFPAMLVGFAALLLGFVASTEIRQSRGRQTGSGLAAAGILCGVLGMFLGPLVFAPRVKAPTRAPPRSTSIVASQRNVT